MTLVEFLTAMLDEDERAAKAWLPLGNPTAADRDHAARHDPARVLREVEAKRRIVKSLDYAKPGSDYWGAVMIQIGFLAAVYADHPDYRQEWKP